jgi:PEP-CTERM motif
MRKRSVIKAACSGLAILAGSFSFMGTAQTVTLLSENFEGSVNVFAAPTYNYSLNYTAPNSLSPGGGLTYMQGGPGSSGSASSKIFTATGSPINLLTGGITGGQIDGGLITYNLYAQFSTYLTQNDNATLFVQFLDAGSSPLGAALQIGGSAFVSALGSDAGGLRDWGADSLTGFVPGGARSANVLLFETKTESGTIIDGYVDNVSLSISVVPEPGSLTLLALGGGLAAMARRRS